MYFSVAIKYRKKRRGGGLDARVLASGSYTVFK